RIFETCGLQPLVTLIDFPVVGGNVVLQASQGVVLVVLGLNIRNRDRLHKHKQIILVANHNSHLDTMVLMSLFPYKEMNKIRPVAAMDYFFKHPIRRWFAP
ncbi:MAG: 1-acyl-sn-glycerol-3-phosphate acyltransferase, partial [Acidimicrobiaceae bacterium]|nr:1-acyl-sn-glycerol-3-phosphate acyltransferase [Acidimicrobiaceae bacterium]